MKPRAVEGRQPTSASASASSNVPELPVWKAFVVQFSRDTRAHGGPFAGRVEHMSSGRRARFASTQGLLATLTSMLADLGEEGNGG